MNLLTRKEETAHAHPLEHCQTIGSHRALSLSSSTAWFWLHVETVLQFSIQWQFQFHVSRSGVRIPVKAIFCDVTRMTTHINQSIKFFKKYSPLIDRCRKLGEGKKRKSCLDWDSNPWPGNVELELPQYAALQHTLDTQSNHAVEGDRESALWLPICLTVLQWVCIGQFPLSASRDSWSEVYYVFVLLTKRFEFTVRGEGPKFATRGKSSNNSPAIRFFPKHTDFDFIDTPWFKLVSESVKT